MSTECHGKDRASNRGYSASPVKFLILPVWTPIHLLQPIINAELDETNMADDEASDEDCSDGDDMEFSDIKIWTSCLFSPLTYNQFCCFENLNNIFSKQEKIISKKTFPPNPGRGVVWGKDRPASCRRVLRVSQATGGSAFPPVFPPFIFLSGLLFSRSGTT
jgi:hypothetical protein